MTAFVYLLHFDRPYPGGQNPQHYLGVCRDLDDRLAEHRSGSSKSRLTRACKEKGIGVSLARRWKKPYPKAAFDHERRLKRQKVSYRAICPMCRLAAIVALARERTGISHLQPREQEAPATPY